MEYLLNLLLLYILALVSLAVGCEVWLCTQPHGFKSSLGLNLGACFLFLINKKTTKFLLGWISFFIGLL